MIVFAFTISSFTPFAETAMSITAYAEDVSYTQMDFDRLCDTHARFISKFGKSAYLADIKTDSISKAYVKQVQIALNYLADYFNINDSTPVDALYGPDARKLTAAVQKKLKIPSDSYFGPGTFTAVTAKLTDILSTPYETVTSTDNKISAKYIHSYQYGNAYPSKSCCTIAACTMLFRANAILNNENPSSITDALMVKRGWVTGAGCRLSFSLNGVTAKAYNVEKYYGAITNAQKQELIKKLLANNRCGLVAYYWNSNGQHAVYMNMVDGKIQIIDPAIKQAKFINPNQSANSVCHSYSNLHQLWLLN